LLGEVSPTLQPACPAGTGACFSGSAHAPPGTPLAVFRFPHHGRGFTCLLPAGPRSPARCDARRSTIVGPTVRSPRRWFCQDGFARCFTQDTHYGKRAAPLPERRRSISDRSASDSRLQREGRYFPRHVSICRYLYIVLGVMSRRLSPAPDGPARRSLISRSGGAGCGNVAAGAGCARLARFGARRDGTPGRADPGASRRGEGGRAACVRGETRAEEVRLSPGARPDSQEELGEVARAVNNNLCLTAKALPDYHPFPDPFQPNPDYSIHD